MSGAESSPLLILFRDLSASCQLTDPMMSNWVRRCYLSHSHFPMTQIPSNDQVCIFLKGRRNQIPSLEFVEGPASHLLSFLQIYLCM